MHSAQSRALLALAVLLVGGVVFAGNRDVATVRAQVQQVHAEHKTNGARLTAVSALFLGTTYKLSPLGEGAQGKRDRDPLIRFDSFDCLTYVEEVMALSWSSRVTRAMPLLQRIRYRDGKISYDTRKHIMMAQWIPQNVKAGFVRDVTKSVGGVATGQAKLRLRPADYTSKAGRKLALFGKARPLGTFTVNIVPTAHMKAAVQRVPHGSIITTIRNAKSGLPHRASHVGLVLVIGGKRIVRHADQRRKRVVQEPLASLVARSARYRTRPVAGFNILAIERNPPEGPRELK